MFSGKSVSLWNNWRSTTRSVLSRNVFSMGKYIGMSFYSLSHNVLENITSSTYFLYYTNLTNLDCIIYVLKGTFIGAVCSVMIMAWIATGKIISQGYGQFSTDQFLKDSVINDCPEYFLKNVTASSGTESYER